MGRTSARRTYQRGHGAPLQTLVPTAEPGYRPEWPDGVERGTLWPSSRKPPKLYDSPPSRRHLRVVEAAEQTLRMCEQLHVVMTKARVLAHLQAYARRCMRVRSFVVLRVSATLAKVFHIWLYWKGHWVVLIFQAWRSWVRGRIEVRECKERERRVEMKLKRKLAANPALQMNCLRCLCAATSPRRWRAFGGWRRGVALVQVERACRRCIAVWAPDCNRQLVRFYAWRRGMQNQQRREELVAQGEAVCRQIRFRVVLLGLHTTVLRRRRLRALSAQLREGRACRCAASVVASWRLVIVSQRERVVDLTLRRRASVVRCMLRAWYTAAVAEEHRRIVLLRQVLHAAMDYTSLRSLEHRVIRRWAKIARRLKLVGYMESMRTQQAEKEARVARAQSLIAGKSVNSGVFAFDVSTPAPAPAFVYGRSSLMGVFERVAEQEKLTHDTAQTVSAAKSRWGRISSQRRTDAERQKMEGFQAVVRELSQKKEQELAARAEADVAARALQETLAEQQQATVASATAEYRQQLADEAAQAAAVALADANRYQAEAEARYREELAAAEAELAAATDAPARGRAQARITRCDIVHDEEQNAARREQEALQRAQAAAAAELAATEHEAAKCRAQQEEMLRRERELLDAKTAAERKAAEAHAFVEKAEGDLAESNYEGALESHEADVETVNNLDGNLPVLTLRETIARVKTHSRMREDLNLPSICEQNEAEAWDDVLENSDVGDLPVDFEAFCATISLVAETVPQLAHLRAATQWARLPTGKGKPQSITEKSGSSHASSNKAKARWGKVTATHRTRAQERARRAENFCNAVIGLKQAKATALAAQATLDAIDHGLAENVAAAEAALASGDLRGQATAAANLQRLRTEHDAAQHKIQSAHSARRHAECELEKAKVEEAGATGAKIWANVMNTRNLSMRFKAWTKHCKIEKLEEDKLIALFHKHADTRWIPLKMFRFWYRVYQRAEKMRLRVRVRNEKQRATCFYGWWHTYRARNLRRQRVLALSLRAWRVWRKRKVSADAFEKLKMRRLTVGWRRVSRALRLYRHSLEALGFVGFVHNHCLRRKCRSVLAAWSKRAYAERVSREAAARRSVKGRDAAWSAWLTFHRIMEKHRIIQQATARRRLAQGWEGWIYLQRLAGRLTPSILLASSSSLYVPRRRKSAIWMIWVDYVRIKYQWRQEELREWSRQKTLQRHLACGNRRKTMVCFACWKHLYVNRLHSVGARTCVAHHRLTHCLRAWCSSLERLKADRAAISRAEAQHVRTVRTIVLYALHRRCVSRRTLRRAMCRAQQIHYSRLGGSVLRQLHAYTKARRADRAVGCFTGWAVLTIAMTSSREHARTRVRELLRELFSAWSFLAMLVCGRYAAQVGMACAFAHWSRHVRCLRNARQRQQWAKSALALMPGGTGLGGNSMALTEGLLQELAVFRAIAAFRDKLVGRRVLRVLYWYASRCRHWQQVVKLVASSLRGAGGVFVRCRLVAWQAWASSSVLKRLAREGSETMAQRWRQRRRYAVVFKTWRELAAADALRRLRAYQLDRVRAGASRRLLRQTVWFEWSDSFFRRRMALNRGRAAMARLLHAAVSTWRGQVVRKEQEAAQWRDIVEFDRSHRTADAFLRWRLFASSEARTLSALAIDNATSTTAASMRQLNPWAFQPVRMPTNASSLAQHSVPRLHNRARHSSVTPATPRTPFHHGQFPGRLRLLGVTSAVGTCVGTPLAESRAVIARYSTPRRAAPVAYYRNTRDGDGDASSKLSNVLFE